MDGWVNRWPGGQDRFTQSHILVRFHKGELSWQITSSPAQQIREEQMEGNENRQFYPLPYSIKFAILNIFDIYNVIIEQ